MFVRPSSFLSSFLCLRARLFCCVARKRERVNLAAISRSFGTIWAQARAMAKSIKKNKEEGSAGQR